MNTKKILPILDRARTSTLLSPAFREHLAGFRIRLLRTLSECIDCGTVRYSTDPSNGQCRYCYNVCRDADGS